MNFYNEHDPKAAAWLRELIKAGEIPNGTVDERSIAEIKPNELSEYTQCHFFAGIGGWPFALKLAGWNPDEPVWTGSCPCQPFSVAGKGRGKDDERHLWPVFAELIRECRPTTVFGEQVASKDGRVWLAGVFADLEGMAYRRAGADLCAASVGTPHIRQRLYWVADSTSNAGAQHERESRDRSRRSSGPHNSAERGNDCRMANGESQRQKWSELDKDASRRGFAANGSSSCWMGSPIQQGLEGHAGDENNRNQPGRFTPEPTGSTPSNGNPIGMGVSNGNGQEPGQPTAESARHGSAAQSASCWDNSQLIYCRDEKYRRIPESGIFPLVNGFPRGLVPSGPPSEQDANETGEARSMRLKGYGNAIVPQLAAEFIGAYLKVIQ